MFMNELGTLVNKKRTKTIIGPSLINGARDAASV